MDFADLNGKPTGRFNVIQLLHGDMFDLNTSEIQADFDINARPETSMIRGIYDVHLASSSSLAVNQFWLEEKVTGVDSIAIITSSSSSAALDYMNFLANQVDNIRLVRTTIGDSCERATDINFLSGVKTFLWAGNNLDQLSEFLQSDPAGKVLYESQTSDNRVHFFIGEDSDYAGPTVATNRTSDALNSFYGDLIFETGLNLVPDMMIVTEMYDPGSTSFYENNTASMIFGIFQGPVSYSLGLNERSYASVEHNNGDRTVSVSGDYSGLFIRNTASLWSAAKQQVNASGDSRQAAGFDQLEFSFLAESPYRLSESISNDGFASELVLESVHDLTYSYDERGLLLTWSHNGPEADKFIISHEGIQIADVDGKDRSYVWSDFENGRISVTAQSGGSSSCEAVTDVSITSAKHLNAEAKIRIYPNPVEKEFTIKLAKPGRVQIHDLQGLLFFDRQVLNGEIIGVTSWSSGIYVLNYCAGNWCIKRKIIVE